MAVLPGGPRYPPQATVAVCVPAAPILAFPAGKAPPLVQLDPSYSSTLVNGAPELIESEKPPIAKPAVCVPAPVNTSLDVFKTTQAPRGGKECRKRLWPDH